MIGSVVSDSATARMSRSPGPASNSTARSALDIHAPQWICACVSGPAVYLCVCLHPRRVSAHVSPPLALVGAGVSTGRARRMSAAQSLDARRFVSVPSAMHREALRRELEDAKLFDIAGEVTRAGSIVLDDAAPAIADAPAIARLRAAGAILIGRTNMTEFAYGRTA